MSFFWDHAALPCTYSHCHPPPISACPLQDKLLGKKRLMSMGDRVTNTLTTLDQGTLYRPTIINAYTDDMSTHPLWWPKWLTFMFDNTVTVMGKTGQVTDKICTLLLPITKAKCVQ